MATLGLHWGPQAFSSCFKQGLPSSCSAQSCCVASLVSQHGLQTNRLQSAKLSNCGSWAQLPLGIWNFPDRVISSALVGGFFYHWTTREVLYNCFQNSFRFTEKKKRQYREFYITLSPSINSLHYYGTFVTVSKPILIRVLQVKAQSIFRFPLLSPDVLARQPLHHTTLFLVILSPQASVPQDSVSEFLCFW